MNTIEFDKKQVKQALRWLTYDSVDLPDGSARVARLPGVRGPGPAHVALFDAVRQVSADRVFVTGPGCGASALWAARAGPAVRYWTANAAEYLSVKETFRENELPPPDSVLDCDYEALTPSLCDLALLHLPRGRDLQAELLRAGGAMLRPGGKLAFVGAKNEGVRTALDEANRLYGAAGIVARKGGYHAGLAYLHATDGSDLPTLTLQSHDLFIEGQPTTLVSCPGAFARDRLDPGARALIQSMETQPAATVLDLGCGTGLVGLAALRRGARAVGTDVSARAVISTRRTWAANGFPDAKVHLCVGATVLPDASVDVVVTNPPFHKGHDVSFEVVRLFIEEAARVLGSDGTIYLVANAFLDYELWLSKHFHAVGLIFDDHHFRVWRGRR